MFRFLYVIQNFSKFGRCCITFYCICSVGNYSDVSFHITKFRNYAVH